MKDPFLPLEEHFFEAVMVCKKNYDVEFEDIVFQTKEKLKPLQKNIIYRYKSTTNVSLHIIKL
jgi:hypothetical protein